MTTLAVVFLVSFVVAVGVLGFLLYRSHRSLFALKERFRPVADADAEKVRVLGEIAIEEAASQNRLVELRAQYDRENATLREHQAEALVAAEAERDRALAQIAIEEAASQRRLIERKAELEREIAVLHEQQTEVRTQIASLEAKSSALQVEFQALDEDANLRSFGFYKPHWDFSDSERYAAELESIREAQKRMLKDKAAAVCPIEWTVNGSKVEGRKQTNQILKLMVRAFNGESDAAIAKVKYNNIQVMEARIEKAWEVLNELGTVNKCQIVATYRDLKAKELRLAHEYQEKLQQEREEQRRIKEQMREEEVARRELDRAKEEAEREEQRYEQALAKAREEVQGATGAKLDKLTGKIDELQRLLVEAQENKQRAISRAEMTRSGHIYVISNLGSFGEHVYKIGMTRRLDPMDRIKELGDASVPFQFDVHAMIFSEDAPTLEATLHRAFTQRRVNRINERKEYFRVSLEEIAAIVKKDRADIEFKMVPEAEEYRKTMALLAEEAGKAA